MKKQRQLWVALCTRELILEFCILYSDVDVHGMLPVLPAEIRIHVQIAAASKIAFFVSLPPTKVISARLVVIIRIGCKMLKIAAILQLAKRFN